MIRLYDIVIQPPDLDFNVSILASPASKNTFTTIQKAINREDPDQISDPDHLDTWRKRPL